METLAQLRKTSLNRHLVEIVMLKGFQWFGLFIRTWCCSDLDSTQSAVISSTSAAGL